MKNSPPIPPQQLSGQAQRIQLLDFQSRPMRAFHVTWLAFFVCFFAWFSVAPLMVVIREDLGLSQEQVGNTIIASVVATIVARIVVGYFCDQVGPRRTYSWLMVLCSFPVMGIGLAESYESFLLCRLAIGAVGASFVVTQFHTSLMFAPECVGTATATTAAWGNLGGGVSQLVVPLLLSVLVAAGIDEGIGWRYAMVAPGLALLCMGFAYGRLTEDSPSGRFEPRVGRDRSLGVAVRDPRVWCLAGLYGACFGVELTLYNVAGLYFHQQFGLGLVGAGAAAALFGFTNIFARSLGGYFSDRVARRRGLAGRASLVAVLVLVEGILLLAFSRVTLLALALPLLFVFGIFVQMAEGATFGVVVFVQRRAMGAVVGLVAAGGNLGAVLAGFLFRLETLEWSVALGYLGLAVAASSVLALCVRFGPEEEAEVAPGGALSSHPAPAPGVEDGPG